MVNTTTASRAEYLTGIMPRIGRSVRARLSRTTQPVEHQMTQGQMMMLHELIERESVTMRELADRDHVAMSTMTETINRLVRQGWVERLMDEQDRRRVRVRITAQGRKKFEEKRRCALGSFTRLLQTLGESDQIKLIKAFQTIERILHV